MSQESRAYTVLLRKRVWERAITAVLCGENLLLVGEKATGKNLFAENLAGVFNRPRWDVSFHVNMDAASLIERIRLAPEK